MPMTPQEWFSRDQMQYVEDKKENGIKSDAIPSVATPKTQEEFDSLPNGTYYIEPEDGHIYQKGNKRHAAPAPTARGTLV